MYICVCVQKLKVIVMAGRKESLFKSLEMHLWKHIMGAYCYYGVMEEQSAVVSMVGGSE